MMETTYYYNPPFRRLSGLGDAASDWFSSNPSAAGDTGGSAAPKKTGTDWVNDALSWLKTGSEVYSNTKGSGGGGTTVINTPAPTSTGMSMTTKVVIGVVAAAAVGGAVYAFRPKKKKKAA